jgi:hypothetical protein
MNLIPPRFLCLFVLITLFTLPIVFATGPVGEHKVVAAPACNYTPAAMTKWMPTDIVCPVCQTKNRFMTVLSYGSYVYQFPSKYELIFWPYTDSLGWYSCEHCHYSAFMSDFETLPKEKIAEITEALKTISLPAQKESGPGSPAEAPPYLALSVSSRMIAAEKIYQILKGYSDEFWSHFNRILGYQLASGGKSAEAAEARQKALKITEKLLQDKTRQGERKELLYICGAMQHFLKNDQAATKAFQEAAALKYSNPKLEADRNKGYDEYLSKLISEYLEMLKKGTGPRDEAKKIAE